MTSTGGPRNSKPGTLNQLFFDAVQRYDKPDALQVKVAGSWRPISHKTLAERVRRAALGLQSLGVRRGDRVAILSENRPEWAIADYACLTAMLTDVPIYPNLPADQAAYILRDSGTVAIFVSNAEQAAKAHGARGSCPALRHIISFGTTRDAGVDHTLEELEAKGAAVETPEKIAAYRQEALTVRPDDLATLI